MPNNFFEQFALAGVSNMIAAAITNPIDVVKVWRGSETERERQRDRDILTDRDRAQTESRPTTSFKDTDTTQRHWSRPDSEH